VPREDVEVVRQLQPPPDVDLADVFMRDVREDDPAATAALEAAEQRFTSDFVCVFHALSREPRHGIVGYREAWLDWLEPWATYRTEIEEIRDLGDRVAVLVRDFGRRHDMVGEIEFRGVAIYTVRDRRIARVEHFTDRSDAAEALSPLR